jgi:branched-chain amino acid transport system ATP-binding protein
MTQTPTPTPALSLTRVRSGYGRYDVLHDIDLTVGRGEAVALLGPNGAGKTTLLRTVLGQVKNRKGTVRVHGSDVTHLRTHQITRGHVGIVPEGRRLFLDQTVEDNLRLGALWLRRDKDRVAALMHDVFDLFPVVERYRHRLAAELSGGEQQMVAIGRMMMGDPQVMLLDEPSLGLAPLAISAMAEALRELRARGRSLLLVEQRVDLALQVCDRLYVLRDGRVVDEDSTARADAEGRRLIDAYLG